MKEKVGEEKKPDSKKPITICRHIENNTTLISEYQKMCKETLPNITDLYETLYKRKVIEGIT